MLQRSLLVRLLLQLASCLLLTLGLLLGNEAASAGVPRQRLEAFYERTRTLHAVFEQYVLGSKGRIQERSQGEVWIKRPGRFRWDYRQPYRQLIVADGETIQFYDPEMEQVTIRDYASGVGRTPSQILAGRGDLERHFRIREEGGRDGRLAWIVLKPREPQEAGFRRARIGLTDSPVKVRRLEFTDALGNRTRIEFSNIRLNPSLEAQHFQFRAPPGTNVLGSGDRDR